VSPLAPAPSSHLARLAIRRFAAWHPEWWVLVISAGAWCFLLGPGWTVGCSCALVAPNAGWRSPEAWGRGLGDWVVMVLAMMLPLMIIPMRATAFGSLWRRRHWAISTFLAGYLTVWTAAGAAILLLLILLRETHASDCRWLSGAGFVAAATWQSTALKRRLSAACHRTSPLAPDGWRAHRDCLRFGADHGIHCVGNCGVLMLAAMLSPWHQPMMVAATVLLLYERYRARPRGCAIPLTLGLLAVWHCVASPIFAGVLD